MPAQHYSQLAADALRVVARRPLPRMLTILGFFIAGILLSDVRLHLPFVSPDLSLWAWISLTGLTLSLVSFCLYRLRRWRSATVVVALSCASLLLGGGRAWWVAAPRTADHIAHHLSENRVDLYGVIAELPIQRRNAVMFTVEAERVFDQKRQVAVEVSGRILVKVYESWVYPRYGDRIVLRNVWPKRPANFNNPGEFNYQRYLASLGFFARVGVNSWLQVDILERNQGNWLTLRLAEVKRRMGALIDWQTGPPTNTVVRALLLGERGLLTQRTEQSFRASGLTHLLAVSGLHVGFVAMACYGVLRAFLALVNALLLSRSSLWLHPRRMAAFLSIWPTLLYGMIVGYRVSSLRATIMILVYLSALLLGRQRQLLLTLAVAAFCVLFWMPGSIYQAGFHLSFAAVVGIVAALEMWRRRQAADPFLASGLESQSPWVRWVQLSLLVTTAAGLGTMPLIAYHFGSVHSWSLLTNAVAVPLATLAIPIGILGLALGLVSSWLAYVPLLFSALLVRLIVAISDLIQGLPGATLEIVTPPLVAVGLAYLGIGLLAYGIPALYGRRVWRFGGIAALAAMFAVSLPPYLPRGETGVLRAAFLNVGQGSAAVVELPNGQVMLVDGGRRWPGGYDTAAYVLTPYLRHRAIRRVDIVVATHRDPDHSGGIPLIVESYGVRHIWTNSAAARNRFTMDLLVAAQRGGANMRELRAGEVIKLGRDVHIEVLNPTKRISARRLHRLDSENDQSLVLRVVYKAASILLTGDIGATVENRLVGVGARLHSTILQAPHHGSRTSSTEMFLRAVRPRAAIASAGRRNRYGHPAASVVRRYASLGIPLYVTSEHGAVIIESDGNGVRLIPTVNPKRIPGPQPLPPLKPQPLLTAKR